MPDSGSNVRNGKQMNLFPFTVACRPIQGLCLRHVDPDAPPPFWSRLVPLGLLWPLLARIGLGRLPGDIMVERRKPPPRYGARDVALGQSRPEPRAVPTEPVTATTHAPLLVIDGDSFAHRAYHALPKTIRRSGNKGAGAILGFANVLLRLYETERPRAVLVGWDTLDQPTYRHEALPGYQSGRSFDDELVDQLDVLPSFVTACGFVCAKAPGYEADDFLAAAVAREERRGGMAVVATGDRDAYQLASERTTILQPVRAGEMARIGPAEVRARYGVDPRQVPDFIALRGDSSDRIPGARGVGPIGAAAVLRRYGSLEKALAAGRFAIEAEKLRLYRSIATMDRTATLPRLRNQRPTWAKVARLARDWQLKQLAGRLDRLAGLPP
jgi:DNA polymerase I